MPLTPADRAALLVVLEEARQRGFLGPGPVTAHLDLAVGMAAACTVPPARALDLGSGGGVPGLVLAMLWPTSDWVLLDSQQRRTEFLTTAVVHLGCGRRVAVVRARAEEGARRPELRGHFDVVMARSFGPPPVTVECGAPFLRRGGLLVVAEPPEERADRWPSAGLALAGLTIDRRGSSPARWIALRQVEACPERLPRRVGIPAKRPLFPGPVSGGA